MSDASFSVLVVEDSPSDALLMERALGASEGACAVRRARRLSEAIAAQEEQAADVALIDLGLPDSEGIATVVRFRKAHPTAAVVVVTGLEDEETARRALSAGAQDYLLKSQLDTPSLLRAVRYAHERSRAEARRRESEEKYRALFECSPYAGFVADHRTLAILEANPAAERLYGWTREELLSMTLPDLFETEERQSVADIAARAAGTGRSVPGVWHQFTKAGRELLVEVSVGLFTFGERPALMTAVADVTAKLHAERDRRQEEQRFRSLFRSEIIGLAVTTTGGAILDANDTLLRLVGYTRDDLPGRRIRWDSLVAPECAAREEAVRRLLRGDETAPPYEAELLAAGGRRVPVLVGTSRLEGSRDTVLSWVIDRTEQRRLEQELRDSQKMEAIGKLAGGVAHDFNNLLTVVNGYADVLLSGSEPLREEAREMIREISRAGRRAAELTKQLLAFSRRQVLAPQLIDPNAAIADMHLLLERLAGERVQLVLDLGPGVGAIRADPGQLEEVLLVLSRNAREAMPSGGVLTIATSEQELDASVAEAAGLTPGRYVVIGVRDTGVGMDAETVAHIFEPFFTTKEKGKATGLGLATVWGVVRQSGGGVFVESAPGAGALFRLFFPAVAAPEAAHAWAGPPPTVLVVENEPSLQSLIRTTLAASGVRVVLAGSPDEALRIAREKDRPVDLVLSDLVMQGMNGISLVSELRRVRPGLKALFVSGYGDQAGAIPPGDAFLAKPFGPAELERRVREALGEPH